MVFQNSLLQYMLSSHYLTFSDSSGGKKPSSWVFPACKSMHLLEMDFVL